MINAILASVIADGGILLSYDKLEPVKFDTGYMVISEDYDGLIMEMEGLDTALLENALEDLSDGIQHNVMLSNSDEPWVVDMRMHGGRLYLDASVNITDLSDAVEFADANDQLAIYDCANDEELMVTDIDLEEHPRIDIPLWLDQDLSPADIAAINYGGCSSGAYMEAVTRNAAMRVMMEHGDDVFNFLVEHRINMSFITSFDSWSAMNCEILSAAVELWCSLHCHLEDGYDDEPLNR